MNLQQMGKRAIKLAEATQHAEAIELWERMHRQEPANAGISMALGAALLAAGRIDDAAQWLVTCGGRHPSDHGIALLTGRTLMQQRRRDHAIGALYHALSLRPDCLETHAHLASALFWHRASAAALPHAERAYRGDLNEFSLSTYLCILLDLGETGRVLSIIDGVLAAGTLNRATLLMYRVATLQALGRVAEGLADAREVVRLMPENDVARHHLAAALLAQGELTAEAWSYYEGRSGLLEMKKWPAQHLCWSGQDIAGQTILVHAEQGLGDTLQFIRYIPLLAARGARVIVAVQSSLVRLLQGMPGADQVIAAGRLPPFDLYCPLLSLPGRFGTTLDTIPPPLRYALPLPRGEGSARFQVGIVWAGGESFIEDRRRSIDPALLAPFGHIADVDFHSLQFNAGAMPIEGMRDAMANVGDFADTACEVAKLDLIIAVDTSVAHLAATMGKPVWLLSRHNGCWRWLLDREDSPWYPTVRLFRQEQDEGWAEVLERVRAALSYVAARYQDAISLAA